MNTFKKLVIPSLLLTGLTLSPLAVAQGSFDGHDVNVKFEVWELDGDKNITSVLAVRNEQDVTASDSNSPDIEGFHALDEDFHLWDIDFNQREIELVFASIQVQDHDNQYMYMTPTGFHVEDTDDSLSDILHVTVDDTYAPSAFNKELVKFDADNIYVNLQGSMCHIAGMASMPECTNEDSPTGYNSIIKLDILFADNADDLYDWGEEKYPELFPSHEESFYLLGYYVREYPGYYLGTKDGNIYLYDKATDEIMDLGEIAPYLHQMHMDMESSSTECPEGQHMMPDGMCMNNSMTM